MKKKIRSINTTFLCLLSILYISTPPHSYSKNPYNQFKAKEKKARAELQLSIGSEKDIEFFYRPRSFTVDHEGYIYILDTGNSRIQCFSPEGQFCYSFGRFGQGPGELSERATRVTLLEDGNLYIIDSPQRKINMYSKKGEYINSYKVDFFVDDIFLKYKTYYLSNIILDKEHKPIHITDDLNKIEKSFGKSFEPTPGIIKKIDSHPILMPVRFEFKNRRFSNIVVNSKEEVIYSQENPYCIAKYSKEGRKLREVVGDVQFDTYFPLKIYLVDGGYDKEVVPIFSRTFSPVMMEDDTFIIPVIIPDESIIYLDVYNSECEQTSRFSISNIFYDNKRKEGIACIHIDKDYNFYCLVIYEDDVPKLLKYKLIFE